MKKRAKRKLKKKHKKMKKLKRTRQKNQNKCDHMFAVIRLRGGIRLRKELADTMMMLGLKRVNTLAILPETDSILGMIKKVQCFVAWGEVSKEIEEELKKNNKKIFHLKPPKKGLKSIKLRYPEGDIGYRGKEINVLIKRMM
jgi:ribosomal protein L30/L7E